MLDFPSKRESSGPGERGKGSTGAGHREQYVRTEIFSECESAGSSFWRAGGRPGKRGPGDFGLGILGVVSDAKYQDLRSPIDPTMYVPSSGGNTSFEVRTRMNSTAVAASIRGVVSQMDSNLPVFDVHTQEELMDQLLFQERMVAKLSGFFGILALVLACIGLYGLLSYEVARRTREIGIRLALGAQRRSVLKLVVGQGIVLAMTGAIVGIGVTLGVTRYLNSMSTTFMRTTLRQLPAWPFC